MSYCGGCSRLSGRASVVRFFPNIDGNTTSTSASSQNEDSDESPSCFRWELQVWS
jgi:hypothetical protein